MKKFLTVLLALSVVFTYTVGSAFAALSTDRDVTREAASKVESELEKVKAAETLYLGSEMTTQVNPANKEIDEGVTFGVIGDKSFEINNAKKVADKVVAQAESELQSQYAIVINKTYNTDEELDSALASITADTYYGSGAFKTKIEGLTDLGKYELEYAQEWYAAIVDAVNLNDYSDVLDEDGDSNRSKVAALKEKALDDIDNATNPYDGGARAIAEKFFTDIKDINTITDDAYDVADLAAAKEIAVAKITAAYAEEKADALAAQNSIIREHERKNPQTQADKDAIAAAQEKIDEINQQYPAALQLMVDQINAVEKITDTIYYASGNSAGSIGTIDGSYKYTYNNRLNTMPNDAAFQLAVEKVAKIDALKADAELAKQYIGIEGSKYYSEAEVDIALAAAIDDVYQAKNTGSLEAITINAMTPAEVLQARIKALTGDNDKDKVVINNKSYDTIKAWEDAVTANKYNYSETVEKEITDLAKDTRDALKEVTSIAEAEKVFTDAFAKFDAYLTTAEHNALYAKDGVLYEKATTYEQMITAAVDAKEALTTGNADYSFNDNTGFANNLIADMKTANTVAELDAKYEEALATINGVKTVTALTAEAKAMNDKALAITDAVAQKSEVIALADQYAAFKDYVKLIDSNHAYVLYDGRVNSYLQTVANADAKAINDAIKEVGTVTVDDKAAIEAIVADYEALTKMMDDYEISTTTPTVSKAAVDKLVSDLSDAQIQDVKNKIATMEMDMTAANVEKIKELQDEFNALKPSQQAQITGLSYDKYVALGKLADKYIENQKLAIEGTHVKIWSSSGKGYIKIRWDQNDNGVTLDGYEVYRSTKKTTGFSKISTFKVQKQKTYKINMKKGTKYYFKVKGYKMVGDEKVYAHDSITVYRTFR